MKITAEFIHDIKEVFKTHSVVMEVHERYNEYGEGTGELVIIRSENFIGDSLPIYIDDMKELARILNG